MRRGAECLCQFPVGKLISAGVVRNPAVFFQSVAPIPGGKDARLGRQCYRTLDEDRVVAAGKQLPQGG